MEEYIASRLYKSEQISTKSIIQDGRQLAQEIEYIDPSTFRVWQTINIIHDHADRKHVYSMNGGDRQPAKAVAITASCYLRVEQNDQGATFTIVAHKKKALVGVRALIECLYGPVQVVGLDAFLKENLELPVLAASLYENSNHKKVFQTFSKPEKLGNLVDNEPAKLTSFYATVDIMAPPLKARTLYINSETHHAGFSIETDIQDEWALINSLFFLFDGAFQGKLPTKANM